MRRGNHQTRTPRNPAWLKTTCAPQRRLGTATDEDVRRTSWEKLLGARAPGRVCRRKQTRTATVDHRPTPNRGENHPFDAPDSSLSLQDPLSISLLSTSALFARGAASTSSSRLRTLEQTGSHNWGLRACPKADDRGQARRAFWRFVRLMTVTRSSGRGHRSAPTTRV
jgi:hypothetical protein